MRHSEVVEELERVERTRNGIGARVRVGKLSDPLIVVQALAGELVLCPDVRRDTGRCYRLTVDGWNDHYDETLNMLRDYETGRSMGVVDEVEVLPGYDVDSLERNYGIEGEVDGMWAPPQFYTRRPSDRHVIRSVTP